MTVSGQPSLEEARLGPRHPLLEEYVEKPCLAHARKRFTAYVQVDLAHCIMLLEQGILRREHASLLTRELVGLLRNGPDHFPWDEKTSSYLAQVERYLTERIGGDVAGRLHTGRSRNDQHAAADRLYIRDGLLAILFDVARLMEVQLDRAIEHAETIIPGYTHLQHAQPWSFGHYLLRQTSILQRDWQRCYGCYGRTNLSALGGAAMAGTSWLLDRHRVAALLGHDGLVVNSCDAGAFNRDYVEELAAVLSILMANLGHTATDLYVWHSDDFNIIEIGDGLCATSSIMPQKKNPRALERIKALGGQAIGWLPAVMGCQRGVLSTDLDLLVANDPVPGMQDATTASLRLMTAVLESVTVKVEAAAARAGAHWSTASHLADELVRRLDIPFRQAHRVVATLVREAIRTGLAPDHLSTAVLDETTERITGQRVGMSKAQLDAALSPRGFLNSRVTEGSVNPDMVRKHAGQLREELHACRKKGEAAADAVRTAYHALIQCAEGILKQ